jgi:hypothetical protein
MVRHDLLNMGVQPLKDVFSILRKNFGAWLQILSLEAEDVLKKNLHKI